MTPFLRHAMVVLALCCAHTMVAAQSQWTAPQSRGHEPARLPSTQPTRLTTIAFLPGIRARADQPIKLADIAHITGPLAQRLANIELVASPADLEPDNNRRAIDDRFIRRALAQRNDLPTSSIVFTGRPCEVRIVNQIVQTPEPLPQTPPKPPAGPTIRDQVRAHITGLFGVEPTAIRIHFDRASQALLDTPLEGRTCEVRSTGSSRRMPFAVALYDDTGIAAEGPVRAEVELLTAVAVTAHAIERGRRITPPDITAQQRWINAMDPVLAPAEAVGRIASRKLRPAQPLDPGDVELPVLVKRGDTVTVRSVFGSAVVRARARALDAGHLNDTIELEILGSKTRLTARVIGRGRAMIAPALQGSSS